MVQNKFALAEQSFSRVIKIKPREVEVLRLHKETLKAQGKHADVVKACERILDLDPRDVEALVDQGDAYTSQGHLPQALRAYQRAADLEEESVRILELVASTQKALGQTDDLMSVADRIIALDPQHKEAWTDRGMLLKDDEFFMWQYFTKRSHRRRGIYTRAICFACDLYADRGYRLGYGDVPTYLEPSRRGEARSGGVCTDSYCWHLRLLKRDVVLARGPLRERFVPVSKAS